MVQRIRGIYCLNLLLVFQEIGVFSHSKVALRKVGMRQVEWCVEIGGNLSIMGCTDES